VEKKKEEKSLVDSR